jgi:hypothetical protein
MPAAINQTAGVMDARLCTASWLTVVGTNGLHRIVINLAVDHFTDDPSTGQSLGFSIIFIDYHGQGIPATCAPNR